VNRIRAFLSAHVITPWRRRGTRAQLTHNLAVLYAAYEEMSAELVATRTQLHAVHAELQQTRDGIDSRMAELDDRIAALTEQARTAVEDLLERFAEVRPQA
jgi:predicted  nucleic acid-binding Zn-ribbon protein